MVSYVVTGAGRGLGLEYVRQLSTNHANVIFALVRDKTRASELQELVLSNEYKNIHVVHADLDDHDSIKAAAEEVSKLTGGSLDVLVNNAALMVYERGMLPLSNFPDEETLEGDLLTFFKTNVIGLTRMINAFLPLIRSGNAKKIIAITSEMGSPHFALRANSQMAGPYAISKAGVNMVVTKYAVALKDKGIIFISINPGLMKTLRGRTKEEVDALYDRIVAHTRVGIPDFSAVTVEDSTRDQVALIERITIADTGTFVHHDGKKLI
ncbi:NAD-binding protein [Phellopilus nigrolimitatus]|nr:NAD-binding protein [Phellopilus nigrolimitatus]